MAKKKQENKVTPLMQQFFEIKDKFPAALLFFQVGDFFELFFEDAVKASSFLNIALTKRGTHLGEPVPLCGVPRHALDVYLTKLVKGGFHVAICEQLEPPSPGRVVKRGVTRVLTPGTLTDTNLLDDKSASYFCSFFPGDDGWGMLFGELLTAQLFATILPKDSARGLESELSRFFPDEVLLPADKHGKQFLPFFKNLGYTTSFNAVTQDQEEQVEDWLANQFHESLQGRLQQMPALKGALQNFYTYLQRCQAPALGQFSNIQLYEPEDFLVLDAATQKHLELVKNTHDGSRKNSLVQFIDKSATAMGSRMLRKWLMRPLVDIDNINRRHDAVSGLVTQIMQREKIVNLLKHVADLERVVGRIALGRGLLVDYLQLRNAIAVIPKLKEVIAQFADILLLLSVADRMIDLNVLWQLLNASLCDDASKNMIIKEGYHPDLDRIRGLVANASNEIIKLEQHEQAQTGIGSLKIRYNNVHGYYIEVTKPNWDAVPEYYMHQQTLVGKKRFMTKELQALQVEISEARSKIETVEGDVFAEVRKQVQTYVHDLRKLAHALSHLDALVGLAGSAYDFGYVRPQFNKQGDIIIKQGRHPVVEQVSQERFIPNDTNLIADESLWILTGPNMGGKSTYLRQVAVTCILAQCGAFVPAGSANVPVLDRIFTRIGASDNLAQGKSTFLVEMEETATICSQATENSLVILDEVGRGTSTFDGLAIAQSVVEYIYQKVGAKCLFATHYHELTTLTDKFPGITSYYAASKRTKDGIVLLHKIVKGVADGSFGVEVARCANLPAEVVTRARELLEELRLEGAKFVPAQASNHHELIELKSELQKKQEIIDYVGGLDLNDMTPKAAFDILWQLQKEL